MRTKEDILKHYPKLDNPDVNLVEVIEKKEFDRLRTKADRLDAENSKLRAALERSCICGEFGYIKDKCPACQALGGEDAPKT